MSLDFPQARASSIPWVDEYLAHMGGFHPFYQTVYYAFLFQRPLTTLEIGTGIGGSLGAMAIAGETIRHMDPSFDYHIWTVDTLETFGDKTLGAVSFLESKIPGRIVFQKSKSLEWNLPIDLLFIDNGHKEGDALGHLERFSPFLVSTGLIVVDDSWFEDMPSSDSRGRTDIKKFLEKNQDSFYVIQARELPSGDSFRGIAFLRRNPK